MAERGEPCEQVLHQLEAVIAALKAAEHALIKTELTDAALTLRESTCPETRAQALDTILALYTFLEHDK
ncbi:MAG: hypothetical protein Fur0018_25320 [Anaerolineales bacterium]